MAPMAPKIINPISRKTTDLIKNEKLAVRIILFFLLALFSILFIFGLAWILLGLPEFRPPGKIGPREVNEIMRMGFSVVAGLGGVAALVIAYRRQSNNDQENRRSHLSSLRENTKLFTERFTTAASQLGDEHPAVRLAGVHALAHLADDAPDDSEQLRQMCIDVLCAYLRMPYESPPIADINKSLEGESQETRDRMLEFLSFREVRHTIIRVISDRLGRETPWRTCYFDFTGVTFDGGSFKDSDFSKGRVRFENNTFIRDRMSFHDVKFPEGKAEFQRCTFNSPVTFRSPDTDSGEVDLTGSVFSGGVASFSGLQRGRITLDQCKIDGGGLNFWGEFRGGTINISETLMEKGLIDFRYCRFLGTGVEISFSKFFGGTLSFRDSRFVSGKVRVDSEFSGTKLDFTGCKISDGHILFSFREDDDEIYYSSGQIPEGLPTSWDITGSGSVVLPDEWYMGRRDS